MRAALLFAVAAAVSLFVPVAEFRSRLVAPELASGAAKQQAVRRSRRPLSSTRGALAFCVAQGGPLAGDCSDGPRAAAKDPA